MTEKQRENRNTWYLSFSRFFTPLPSHKEGIFHSALTQKYSLCTKPPSLLPAFSASHLHKEKTQDPRAGPYPCKKNQVFISNPFCFCFVCSSGHTELTTEQPQALSPEHRVPRNPGLCLFSSAHPFRRNISQT